MNEGFSSNEDEYMDAGDTLAHIVQELKSSPDNVELQQRRRKAVDDLLRKAIEVYAPAKPKPPLLYVAPFARHEVKVVVPTETPEEVPKEITQPQEVAHLVALRIEEVSQADAEKVLEVVEIQGEEFLGKSLTSEILKKEGLLPRHKIQIGDSVVWLSSSGYSLGEGRIAVVAYVEKEGKISARSYWRSNSQGMWRYLPEYEMMGDEISWYGKGHGEESIALPIALQQALAEITSDETSIKEVQDAEFIFAGTARRVGKKEGAYYEEVESTPQKLQGNFHTETPYGLKKRKTDPEQMILSPEESPDFSRRIATWQQHSDLYGEFTVEVFPSQDGSLKFMFCKDSEGRAWIGGIENDSEMQSTGLKKTWVDGGDLATPAYEYKNQSGKFGNLEDRQGKYVDMFKNYLSKIPVIQEYLRVSASNA